MEVLGYKRYKDKNLICQWRKHTKKKNPENEINGRTRKKERREHK